MDRMILSRLAALLAVAGVGSWASAMSANVGSPRAAVLTMPAEAVGQVISPVPCVRGFSKDACAGEFSGGSGSFTNCSISTVPCQTLTVTGQKWAFDLRSNTEVCAPSTTTPTRCDEVKDGRFEAAVDFTLRLNDPCKYRGCIEGDGTFISDTGAVFAGRVMGTMGAGTDRRPRCPTSTEPPFLPAGCEKCWDVELQVGTTVKMWRVGVDASFHGVRIDADTGEEVCLTISGDFFARGDGTGIFDLINGWTYYGNADGVYIFQCPGIGTP